MEKLHKDRAKAEATRIARDILEPLKQPWLSAATTQPHNVKQPPASETTADVYPKLIDKLQAKHPGVLKYGRTQLLDQSGLIDDPALGTASAAGAEGQLSLSEAAFLVPGTDAKLDGNPNQQRFVRNLYETAAEPFVTPGGNAYVVRTVAVRARKAPEMDAIRQRLIDDVRRARAYQEAERQARALAEKAGQVGVEKALEADATLMTKLGKDALKKSEPFPRQQSYGMELYPASVPGLGFDNELVKNIFTLAGKTTTQPVNVLVHEQKPQQRWLVVQLLEIQPVTQAEYDQQRTRALMTLRIQRQIEVLSNWFNPQQIRDRINWKDAEKPAPKEAEKDESA